MQSAVPKGEGGMIAVLGSKIEFIEKLLEENSNRYQCFIANDNSNGQLVLSGKNEDLEKLFEIFSLNLQIIIIYFWIIKRPSLMGTGHIFSAGLINDVVMGFPLGISSLSYLVVCFVGNYVRNKSVNTTIASDWFTFLIALLFANLLFFSLLNNFSEVAISYSKIGYNTFFTLFLFPVFWLLFNLYQMSFIGSQDA